MTQPCAEYETQVEALLADELEHAGRERLLEHAMRCAACRAYVDLHHGLADGALDDGLPSDEEFAAMRERVRWLARATRREPDADRAVGVRRGRFRVAAWRGLAVAASAALLLFAGFVAGRRGDGAQGIELVGPDGALMQPAVDRGEGLEAFAQTPYVYSNVTFQEAGDGRLDLSFDVTRHMKIRRAADDPLVRDVLVSSLLDPAPVGTRLQAATYAARSMDPTVKEALLASLRHDPSQAVRGRCLDLLAPLRDDPEVQQALVAVLREEEEVGLRLDAVDLLAESDSGRVRLDRAMEDLDGPDDRALLVRAANRLR